MAESPKLPMQPLPSDKPRLRPVEDGKSWATADSYQNLLTKTGVGADNLSSGGRYGFNPLTRNRLQLEWAYRGSWIVGTIVDCVAEDMTREGVEVQSSDKPDVLQKLDKTIARLCVWSQLQDVIKWARLYGGAIGYCMIDGADPATPLDRDAVTKGQFRGVLPLDRWAAQPDLTNLVTELGPHFGEPKFYQVMRSDSGSSVTNIRIHYSRIFRMVGVELPYWQLITENYWGMSVIERLWDRLVAFDSTTQGTAQLVYKAHLRTYKVKDLRKIVAAGGPAFDGLAKQMSLIRAYQSSEGLTLMDVDDEFEVHPYSFSGLDLVLLQMGQQLSGASQIPLVRLFGQSPAGLNSTGEADLRTYYDGIARQQGNQLREGAEMVYDLGYRSTHGRPPPDDFSLAFKKLWQMDDEQRSNVAVATTAAVLSAVEKNVVARSTALKELRQSSKTTGMWSNITPEMIKEAEDEDDEKPPSPDELAAFAAASKGGGDGDPEDEGRRADGNEPAPKPNGNGAAAVRKAAEGDRQAHR